MIIMKVWEKNLLQFISSFSICCFPCLLRSSPLQLIFSLHYAESAYQRSHVICRVPVSELLPYWFHQTLLASGTQFPLLIVLISQANFLKGACYSFISVIDRDRKPRIPTPCLHKPLSVAILFPISNQFSTQLAVSFCRFFIYLLLIWFSLACNCLELKYSEHSVMNIISRSISKELQVVVSPNQYQQENI